MDLNAKIAAAGGADEIDEEIPAELVAAIAAAITGFVGRDFRLLSVTDRDQVSRWTRQGRTVVQGSHNVRRKTR